VRQRGPRLLSSPRPGIREIKNAGLLRDRTAVAHITKKHPSELLVHLEPVLAIDLRDPLLDQRLPEEALSKVEQLLGDGDVHVGQGGRAPAEDPPTVELARHEVALHRLDVLSLDVREILADPWMGIDLLVEACVHALQGLAAPDPIEERVGLSARALLTKHIGYRHGFPLAMDP